MTRVLSVLTVMGGLLAGGLMAGPAHAAHPGVLRVEDKAGAFTPDGIKKAEQQFHDVNFKSTTHLTVVTVNDSHVPGHLKSDFEAARKDQSLARRFFKEWATETAKAERERGVFVLAYLQGDKFYIDVEVDRQTDLKRHFTDADALKLSQVMQDGFRSAKGKSEELARHTRDAALLAATADVVSQLKNTSAPEERTSTRASRGEEDSQSRGGMSIMGWVCVLLLVGLGVWLVIGLIRAFTGTGGYAGGGYGGGYGYGGGGFFPSLMGGMFGAMAGMWLYDQFTGSHYHNDAMAADSGGSDGGDTGAGDFDGGTGAGGGDFGDTGGGDFGDTGGDVGGGDFGGGDFGGGDFGGGDFGGGDW